MIESFHLITDIFIDNIENSLLLLNVVNKYIKLPYRKNKNYQET